jgi:hypothetical protein
LIPKNERTCLPYSASLIEIAEPDFANQCVSWIKQTAFIDFIDVLRNKKCLLFIYQIVLDQYRAVSALSVSINGLLESCYLKLEAENNPVRFLGLIAELVKNAPEDFSRVFLMKLSVAVYGESQLMCAYNFIKEKSTAETVSDFTCFIDKIFAVEQASPELIKKFDGHFRDKLAAELKTEEDAQAVGFRTSGSAFFSLSSSSATAASLSSSSSSSSASNASLHQESGQYSMIFSAMTGMANWLSSWKK